MILIIKSNEGIFNFVIRNVCKWKRLKLDHVCVDKID